MLRASVGNFLFGIVLYGNDLPSKAERPAIIPCAGCDTRRLYARGGAAHCRLRWTAALFGLSVPVRTGGIRSDTAVAALRRTTLRIHNAPERWQLYRVRASIQRRAAYSFRRFRGAFRGFAAGRSAFSFSVGTGRCRLRGRYPSGAVRTGRRSATVREKNSFEAIRFSCRCESGRYVKEGRIPCPAGTWREMNGRASRCRWLTVRFGNETGRSCHFSC